MEALNPYGKLNEAEQERLVARQKTLKKLNITDQRTLAAIESCQELFSLALDHLNDCVSIKDTNLVETLNDLRTWLSSAGTNQQTCLDELEDSSDGSIDESISSLGAIGRRRLMGFGGGDGMRSGFPVRRGGCCRRRQRGLRLMLWWRKMEVGSIRLLRQLLKLPEKTVFGQGFIARDMGFKNTAGPAKHQAVALMSTADHSVFYRCTMDAYQDTLYPHSNRQFYRECNVYGTVDFIFGNSAVVFQNCYILPKKPMQGQQNTITAQGKVDPNQNTGISIQNCTIRPAENLVGVNNFLGRPGRILDHCSVPQCDGPFHRPEGLATVGRHIGPDTIFYAEFQNSGLGHQQLSSQWRFDLASGQRLPSNEESRRKEQAFSTEQNALVTENSDRRGRNKIEKDDKDTTAVATDGDVVIICDDACVSSSCQETDWIIDSGASYHITPHRDMFTSYTSGNFGRVRMANHGVTEVIGMGNINLETDTGCRLILRDVRHIPDIRLNIISTGKLDDDGYVSNFGEGKWKLTKGSLITAKGKKKNSLYLMQANYPMERSSSFTYNSGSRGRCTDEQNDITDDEPVDDQVPPIQTDDPVLPQEATLDKVHTDDNGADMLTKSLPREKLEVCKSEAGLVVPPT
ncbi:hypothetical protein BUALT_Bualt06G0125100 [Buddleja alternifolia]|uniref:Pectinesterase n=1 Tax=Buddleja alternifolia TaxID=168488 RepID=A0AAV6XML3_9LAMI|nr:hypothetical protein BUALT_Bualt06G0125100 [Buddleja alternifolia]